MILPISAKRVLKKQGYKTLKDLKGVNPYKIPKMTKIGIAYLLEINEMDTPGLLHIPEKKDPEINESTLCKELPMSTRLSNSLMYAKMDTLENIGKDPKKTPGGRKWLMLRGMGPGTYDELKTLMIKIEWW